MCSYMTLRGKYVVIERMCGLVGKCVWLCVDSECGKCLRVKCAW